jgi:NAD(P)-dependent dehydrogenase (short-subunit alcohol dehydrogenase family)
MDQVCVITGGGSGMGLATARLLGQGRRVVISGRTAAKLDAATRELREQGIDGHAVECDVSDKASVERLAATARELGSISTVVHAAGISPSMGDAERVLAINALGTAHVHEVFPRYMERDACIIDVASMGGYMLPGWLLPTAAYPLCFSQPQRFMRKTLGRSRWFPKKLRSGVAYAISKNFVIWLAQADAGRLGAQGIRVLSVSPGTFETDMGEAEREDAEPLIDYCAIKRFGRVDEVARLLAFCADERLGYLTGVDILCDGGCVSGYRRRRQQPPGLAGAALL